MLENGAELVAEHYCAGQSGGCVQLLTQVMEETKYEQKLAVIADPEHVKQIARIMGTDIDPLVASEAEKIKLLNDWREIAMASVAPAGGVLNRPVNIAGAGAKLQGNGAGSPDVKTVKVNAPGADTIVDVPKKVDNSVIGKPRVGSANKTDATHRFNDIIDNYAGDASKFDILTKGPGGKVIRTSELRQIEGSQNGKSGIFEWIVDQGNVTHRRFILGGKVTGFPNQVPKK